MVGLSRAHKAVIWFASPFFQAALGGDWAETERPHSMSAMRISQPPVLGDKLHHGARMDPDLDRDELDIESSEPELIESSSSSLLLLEGTTSRAVL
jgi:hypothetical protein